MTVDDLHNDGLSSQGGTTGSLQISGGGNTAKNRRRMMPLIGIEQIGSCFVFQQMQPKSIGSQNVGWASHELLSSLLNEKIEGLLWSTVRRRSGCKARWESCNSICADRRCIVRHTEVVRLLQVSHLVAVLQPLSGRRSCNNR